MQIKALRPHYAADMCAGNMNRVREEGGARQLAQPALALRGQLFREEIGPCT